MPWLPSTCSSSPITRSIGTSGRPCAGGSRPTCTCRPRGRRHRIEFAQVTAAPSASSETCAPPPVSSTTAAGTSARPSTVCSAPSAAGECQRAGGDVDRDHPRTGRRRDLDGGQPHTPAAVHRHPFPGLDLRHLHDRPEGRGVAAAERGGGGQVELLRDGDEVDVGGVEGDELRERAPVGEPGLGLARADLLLAGRALGAGPAGVHERHGHPVADAPAPHARADRGHRAGQLVTGHVRQDDVRIVALPGVPVAAADPARRHPHDDAARRRLRSRHLAHLERTTEGVEDQRAHVRQPALRRSSSARSGVPQDRGSRACRASTA